MSWQEDVPSRHERSSRDMLALVAAVLFSLLLLMAFPQPTHASPIVLEDRAPSLARLTSGVVTGAQRIDASGDPLRIYGTFKVGEQADAFEFVAPATVEAQVSLLVGESAKTGDARLMVTVLSADGRSLGQASTPGPATAEFDWLSLQRLRVEGNGVLALHAGQTYFVVIQPGTVTDATVSYSIVITGLTSSTTERLDSNAVASTARLWLGAYAQHPIRGIPLIVAIVLALLVLGIVVSMVVSAVRRLAKWIGFGAHDADEWNSPGVRSGTSSGSPRPQYAGPPLGQGGYTPLLVAPPAPAISRHRPAEYRPTYEPPTSWPTEELGAAGESQRETGWEPAPEPVPEPILQLVEDEKPISEAAWEAELLAVSEPKPEREAEPEPEPEPEPEQLPEPEAEPAPEPEADAETGMASLLEPELEWGPAPEEEPASVPEPEPEPEPEPVPELELEPELEWGPAAASAPQKGGSIEGAVSTARAPQAGKKARRERIPGIPRRTPADLVLDLFRQARIALNLESESYGDDDSFSYEERIKPYAKVFEDSARADSPERRP
ncbi:MAG TPA: hypothetical protein VFE45_09795 [Coriobacteriia bacterium]|nr:hypothetical protein [Coriobacteriia bacterium]